MLILNVVTLLLYIEEYNLTRRNAMHQVFQIDNKYYIDD